MHAAAPLEHVDGNALRVAVALDALEARAIGLDVARAVERLRYELVARLGCADLPGKIVARTCVGRERPGAAYVDGIPEDVHLDGRHVLVAAMAECVEERLPDCCRGAVLFAKGELEPAFRPNPVF